MADQDAYTIAQAAERLHVSKETVRQMVLNGELAAVRLRKRIVRIPVTAIEEILAPERRIMSVEDGEFG